MAARTSPAGSVIHAAATNSLGNALSAAALERGRALLLSEALRLDRQEAERLTATGRADLQERYETAVSRWNQLARS